MSADPTSTPFVPADAASPEATVFDCPLCGATFSHGALACESCPLHLGCDVVKCPHCGYQYPRTSRIVTWARRLARRAAGSAR
jgi:predicted amidophosphoribosyltransferase